MSPKEKQKCLVPCMNARQAFPFLQSLQIVLWVVASFIRTEKRVEWKGNKIGLHTIHPFFQNKRHSGL